MEMAEVDDSRALFAGTLRLDKRPGLGEDAEPFAYLYEGRAALGVFDGLGGAGAEIYETAEGPKSGAAIGANVAAHVARQVLAVTTGAAVGSKLKDAISARLKLSLQTLGGEASALKGRLVRKLPTTIAVMEVVPSPNRDSWVCASYWSGDSRLYYLDYLGLHQLSRDHLAVANDPMQNLLQDSELSNCARADAEFYIEHSETSPIRHGFVAIAATDGVFGYLSTPMHFEHLLHETMSKSTSFEGWEELLRREIRAYTQDDATLAYVAVGWKSFDSLKDEFHTRSGRVADDMRALQRASQLAMEAKLSAEAASEHYEDARGAQWDEFRVEYEFTGPTERI